MQNSDSPEHPLAGVSPRLAEAFAERGFTELTAVQNAVLDAECDGRDLRITSATGSGKTLAVGIALVQDIESYEGPGPRAVVIAPTRELAAQLRRELSWMLDVGSRGIAVVQGGTSYGREIDALSRDPRVVVGTPGRMVDHIQRGNLDLSHAGVVVLDEADQLLDLGFREELDAILEACPIERRTLLVSATFGRAVLSLADAHQRDPLFIQGTAGGRAHEDITYKVHVVAEHDRFAALNNVLLSIGEGRCLVFVATRAQTADLSEALARRRFRAAPISGDMTQPERNRTLAAFRSGRIQVLVATDVAARGIDIDDIHAVIHAGPPRDADTLVHRSGRTGRAGRSGQSIQICAPRDVRLLQRLLRTCRIDAEWGPPPGVAELREQADTRLLEAITGADPEIELPERDLRLAQQLLEGEAPEQAVARMIGRLRRNEAGEPMEVSPPPSRRESSRPPRGQGGNYASFEVNWGQRRGATAQRLMAMVCRRGRVSRQHVGNIQINEFNAYVEIDSRVAEEFAAAAGRRDSRDKHITIKPARGPARPRHPQRKWRKHDNRGPGPGKGKGGRRFR